MNDFKNIDVAELKGLRERGRVNLIDVRTDAEVAQGMLAGASHIPLHLLPLKAQELDSAVPTVFYCRSGGRSAQACAFLAAKGVGNLHNLQGGIQAWVNSGFPVAIAA